MKGNTIYIVLGVVVVAIVAFFLMRENDKTRLFNAKALAGAYSNTDSTSSDSLTKATAAYNTLRAPDETFDQWYARRKADGWSF